MWRISAPRLWVLIKVVSPSRRNPNCCGRAVDLAGLHRGGEHGLSWSPGAAVVRRRWSAAGRADVRAGAISTTEDVVVSGNRIADSLVTRMVTMEEKEHNVVMDMERNGGLGGSTPLLAQRVRECRWI